MAGPCASVWEILEAARPAAAREALVEGERRQDWAATRARVLARLAGLERAGIAPGERVALLAHNGADFLEATFALAGRGAVAVPLNARWSARELAFALGDAGARLLLHGPEFAAVAAELARAGAVPAVRPLGALEPGGAPRPVRVEPDALAFLYYTSGTTGLPKGVMLTHANVCVHAAWAVAELGLGAQDRWAHVAPMFHLADAWATLALTQVGGAHLMAPRFEPRAVLDLLERERATLTNLVPTMLGRLVADPAIEGRRFPALRRILSGGAPIAPTLVRRVALAFGCEYVQTYGMTETSPFLTMSLLDARHAALDEEGRWRARARTGRPFAGVELEVVDAQDRPVPADDRSVGEIRVRAPTVSPGYWRRPAETAEVFRDGWLYTGDLAVRDALGSVDIVDRKKDVILTGGETVYSTEVEHALAAHPAVLEAAAYGVPDDAWGELVCAAVALRAGAQAGADELVAFCRERLAGYKVPRRLRFLDELPRTGSGKIAKRLLRDEGAR